MPSVRPGVARRRRGLWLLASTLSLTVIAAASSCGSTEKPPVASATTPASSAARARARAQRQSRAAARAEQFARPEAAPAPAPPPPPPEPEPEPAKAPEPAPTSEPAADSEPLDAGVGGAAPAADDAGVATADAGPVTPQALCAKICGRVITCLDEIFGGAGAPPGIDAEEFRGRLRQECLDECEGEIEGNQADGEACLAIEDCKPFLDCVREIGE